MTIRTIIFDFGNVINRWEPELALAELYPNKSLALLALEKYALREWVDAVLDSGRNIDASLAEIGSTDPERHCVLRCYLDNIAKAHASAVPGTAEIIENLAVNGFRILGMTNAGIPAWQALSKQFPVTSLMQDVFVSAAEGLKKPDPRAYACLLSRNDLEARECLFIDDNAANVTGARNVGMTALHFLDAGKLREDLRQLGLLKRKAVA